MRTPYFFQLSVGSHCPKSEIISLAQMKTSLLKSSSSLFLDNKALRNRSKRNLSYSTECSPSHFSSPVENHVPSVYTLILQQLLTYLPNDGVRKHKKANTALFLLGPLVFFSFFSRCLTYSLYLSSFKHFPHHLLFFNIVVRLK